MIEKLKKEIDKLWSAYDRAKTRERRISIRSEIIQTQTKIDHLRMIEFENEIKKMMQE